MKIFFFLFCSICLLGADPHVTLTVNGLRQVEIVAGEPLIVCASATGGTEAAETAAALKPAGSLNLELVERVGTSAAFADWQVVTRVWTASPAATAQLPPGTYSLSLDAASAVITVRDTAPEADTQYQSRRALILSQWHSLEGRTEEALAATEALLQLQPNNLAAMVRKADVLVSAGRLADALGVLDAAEMAFSRLEPRPPVSPVSIRKRQEKVLEAMTSQR